MLHILELLFSNKHPVDEDYDFVKLHGVEIRKESEYLKNKREEIVERDRQLGDNALLLINNNSRKVSLYSNHVLKG